LSQREHLIKQHGLLRHPEGGFYKEVHRAESRVRIVGGAYDRSAYTSIFYLLSGDDFSAWHRIRSDETWFFHSGCDLAIYSFSKTGQLQKQRLGTDSGCVQYTIAAGTWFAAQPEAYTSFSFVSCVVAPGFEFEDFELASRQYLLDQFGHCAEHREKIEALTRVAV